MAMVKKRYLLTAAGFKMFLFKYKDGLEPIAFYDAGVHTVSLTTVKSLIVAGDAFNSVRFMRWKVPVVCIAACTSAAPSLPLLLMLCLPLMHPLSNEKLASVSWLATHDAHKPAPRALS